MNHPRRTRSPPFGYDSRSMNPRPIQLGAEYDSDPYGPPFEPTQAGPAFIDPHLQYPGYRDNRLPSTYRATLREQFNPVATASAPYKILCITNLNQKVSDGQIKDALKNDFCRFGDVSVSICHDSGERLAYIYFRTYEEAREARHSKAKTMLFDRPIEIEPIYEPRTSPLDSPPPPTAQPIYPRRRSITPPEYYEVGGQIISESRRLPTIPPQPISHSRAMSPPEYLLPSRYPPGPSPPLPPAPMPYDSRYYMQPAHMLPQSPYSSPPHEPYRHYHHQEPMSPGYGFQPSPYGPPTIVRERDRPPNDDLLMPRSPRHEPYLPIDARGYPPGPPMQHNSAPRDSPYSSLNHQYHHLTHHSHHHHSLGTHHQSSSSYRSPPPPPHPDPPRYASRDFRREKFDSFNSDHDESRPSRVLIINNIDAAKSEAEIRSTFEPFGIIEDIEVRKIAPDISSALIKFSSMDAAYKAKTATNGRYLGSLRCRVIYGKVNASRRLWIGGLSPASTLSCLEDEVSKFGNVINLDYTSGRPYAYVEYSSANQAQFAAHRLRSTLVPAAERKIRIEFVDPERSEKISRSDPSLQVTDMSSRSRTTNEPWSTNELEPSPQSVSRKRSKTPTDTGHKRFCHETDLALGNSRKSDQILSHHHDHQSLVADSGDIGCEMNNNGKSRDNRSVEGGHDDDDRIRSPYGNSESMEKLIYNSTSIREIVGCCATSWPSQIVLRNFTFHSRTYMCSGRESVLNRYLGRPNGENGDECPILRITQRWRLHPQPKLEEVKRRMQSGNLGILLITSRVDQSPALSSPTSSAQKKVASNGDSSKATTNDPPTGEMCENSSETATTSTNTPTSSKMGASQARPLKNLISYLEQKDAAGVISLTPTTSDSGEKQADGSKLLYAFPPGEFALNLLRRLAPKLVTDCRKDEFLLGVIVSGSSAGDVSKV